MPRIDLSTLTPRVGSPNYPAAYKPVCAGRHKTALGNAVGLTQFGVNLTRLEPGAATALRHWHENEDEFIYILQGEATLIENDGETIMKPGDCAGFKANVDNGHCVVNRTENDVLLLEVGTRAPSDVVSYPEADLLFDRSTGVLRVLHKSGEPY